MPTLVNLLLAAGMTVTMLGTGTPFPDSARFGSAILVEAGGIRLLFDCGRGAVIRLSQIGRAPSEIDGVFLTHLHSDHIVGLPDLWLTGRFLKPEHRLRLWGPADTRSMAEHLIEAYAFDLRVREGPPESLDARDIEPGVVYDNGEQTASFMPRGARVRATQPRQPSDPSPRQKMRPACSRPSRRSSR